MHEKESKLIECFKKANHNKTMLQLENAFATFTPDMISQYSWGVSFKFLNNEYFNSNIRQPVNKVFLLIHISKFFPILGTIVSGIP